MSILYGFRSGFAGQLREEDVIGRRCQELFPKVLSEVYVARNREVRTTGRPIVNRVYAHSADKTPDRYGKVRRAVAYIDGHFDKPLSLADLAAETGISTSSFSHAFKRITETSPANYITTIRLNHARTLLRETDRPQRHRHLQFQRVKQHTLAFHLSAVTLTSSRRSPVTWFERTGHP